MSLQPQESLIADENLFGRKRPPFGLGRFLFRRSRASRKKAATRAVSENAGLVIGGNSEWLEDRTLLAAFNPLAATPDGTAGSLRDAINMANSNGEVDTITLEAGTYSLTVGNTAGQENSAVEGDLDILSDGDNSLTIIGAGAGSTIISQMVADRVFQIFGDANVTFQGVTITGGQAVDDGSAGALAPVGDGNGGGILIAATADVTVTSSEITSNSAAGADPGEGGGGIFNAGTLTIGDSNITSNTATAGALGNGGGIFNDSGATLNITGGTIASNMANRAGGGIENNDGTVTLTGVTLGGATPADGNTAGINGGGLHVSGNGTTNLNGGTVQNNTAAQEGGGLWNGFGTMTIDGVSITNNTASGDGSDQGGGGVFNVGGPVIIQNSTTIAGNVANGALGSGGGILHTGGSDLLISDSVISGNTANRAGGGIEVNTSVFPFVTLTNVNLDGNSAGVDIGDGATAAPGNGGGLHVTGQSSVGIDGGTVNNNVAAAEGGGLWNNTGDMDVFGATISGNSAGGTLVDQGGGAIFNAGGNVDVNDSTLSGNTATSGFGNAIFNEGGAVAVGMTTVQGDIAGGDLTDESFDIFDANVTIISQGGDDITTVSGDVTDDGFTVTRDLVGTGVTVTVVTSATFTINSDSETLVLFGETVDDNFVVDFGSVSNFGTVNLIAVDADGQTTADVLTLRGLATFSQVAQTTTSATDGVFLLNNALTISYENIESVVDELVRGLSLGQTGDQTIAAGNGPVDILISSTTDDGEVPVLTVGALPTYASFVDNGNGQAVVTLNPASLDAGTMADITVTATSSNGVVSDTFAVNVVSPALSFPNDTIFSINSGGRAVGGFGNDNFFNAGSTFGTGATIDASDASIPVGTPAGIFNSTRFDFNGGPELQYAFPVNPGNYDVTLFFAEIYSPVFRTGGRVFDVSIEGVLLLDDFDVFTQAGAGNTAIARTFNVTTDGTLNIDFGHVVENPMVMGIQIVDLNGVPNIGPTLDSVTPLVNLLSGQSTTIDVSASDPEGDPITLTAVGLPPFASFIDNGNGTGTITVNSTATDEGVFGISVQASSGTPALTDSTSFSLRVAPFVPEPIPNEVININAGGPAITGDPAFAGDRAFQNGVGLNFGTGAAIDTTDASIPTGTPAEIFNTVLFDFNGGAELQLDVPTQQTGIMYEVTLYFVEIYGPAARTGARVFDVSIDGQLVLDNFDVFAAAGAINRGIAETFQITSDGNVDIDFGHVVENPALAGVTVRQIDQVFTSAPS